MFDLNAFFDGMSKPLLRNAHAKAFGHKGLLNNALIQNETLSFYLVLIIISFRFPCH